MSRRSNRSRLMAALGAATLLVAVSAGSVLGGEVTGNGKPTPIKTYRANSICAFSGLNDREAGEGPTDTRVQNWGVTPIPELGHPSVSCNGHHGLLAGGGE